MKDKFKFIRKMLVGVLVCALFFETVVPLGFVSTAAAYEGSLSANAAGGNNMVATNNDTNNNNVTGDSAGYETADPITDNLPAAGNGAAETNSLPETEFNVQTNPYHQDQTFDTDSKSTRAATKHAKVHSDIGLNIRTGPGTEYGKIGRLNDNDVVRYLGSARAKNGAIWYKLDCSFGVGYGHSDYLEILAEYEYDKEFEKSIADFPNSYKDSLRNLHALYPNWHFVADHTGLDWNSVIREESNPVSTNLIHYTEPDSRKSVEPGAYNPLTNNYKSYDSGGWVPAHTDTIRYYMDPRNFLTNNSVFQFMSNKYDPATATVANVESVVDGTFMDTKFPERISNAFYNNFKKAFPNEKVSQNSFRYSHVLLLIGKSTGVNPMVIASIIIQEQGSNGKGNSINQDRVKYYPHLKPYAGYYNHFNIGAYAQNGKSAVENGLIYAVNHGWSSIYRSILGGADWFGSRYVKNNKYNTYLKKFNVKNGLNAVGTGQYMTNVRGAYDEGCRLYNGYKNLLDKELTFTIPIYNSMPATPCKLPSPSGSNINYLKALSANYKVPGTNSTKALAISPRFNPFTYEYSMTVPDNASKIRLYPVVSDNSAKYYIYKSDKYNQVDIPVGTTPVKIRVTSSTGKNRYYTINVTRRGSVNPPKPTAPAKVTGITVQPDYTLLKVSFDKSKDTSVTGYRIAIRELYDNASGSSQYGDWQYINISDNSTLIKGLKRGGHYEIRVAAINAKDNLRSDYSAGTKIYTNRGGDRPAIMKTPRIEKMTVTNNSIKLTARDIRYVSAPQTVTYRFAYREKGSTKWTYVNSNSNVITIPNLNKGKTYTFAVGYYYTSALDNKTRVYSNYSEYKDLKI